MQAWIDLLPDWQTAHARRVDALVTRQVPNVHKAIKWHGAWYGVPGQGWFLAVGSFKAHLKLVFFDGASLTPVFPNPQRALEVREAAKLDETNSPGGRSKQANCPAVATDRQNCPVCAKLLLCVSKSVYAEPNLNCFHLP